MPKYANPVWTLSSSLDATRAINRLMDEHPPAYEVRAQQYSLTQSQQDFFNGNLPNSAIGIVCPWPDELLGLPPVMIIRAKEFPFDFVEQGGPFFSRRLRETLDLEPSIVQYLPVDVSLSEAEARTRDYKRVSPLAYQAVVDLDRSEVIRMPIDQLGRPGPERVVAVRRVALRTDFTPEYELFFDPHDQRIYVTDNLAARVVEAGFPEIAFRHPETGEPRSR